MIQYRFLFICIVLLVSCKNTNKEHKSGNPEAEPIVALTPPVAGNSHLPRLFSAPDGLYLSWVESNDDFQVMKWSRWNGTDWLQADTIVSGTDWFVNWADFPQFAVNSEYKLSSYLKKSASGTYTYDILLNHFNLENQQWKSNLSLHTDATQSEHGFVSMQPYGDKSFFVSWLDGRNTVGGHDHENPTNGAMSLRSAFIDSLGQVYNEEELDSRVCDCCNTASTVTPDGVVVAYRNRTEDEIRDIAIIRLSNDTWGDPVIVGNDNWKIPGCPVNGPAIDSYGRTVAVAWFTAANEVPMVQLAFSTDGGKSFGLPIRIDSGNATGRVDLELLGENQAVVSWMEPSNGEEVIRIRSCKLDGSKGLAQTISKTTSERASGFPQMELFKNRLYLAWTLSFEEHSEIRMASVSLGEL